MPETSEVTRSAGHRRATIALLASTLLHGLGVWLAYLLIPPELEKRVFRVRVPVRKMEIERLRPRPPIPVPHQLLERLRAEKDLSDLEMDPGMEEVAPLPEMEIPHLDEGIILAKKEWRRSVGEGDTLDARLSLLEHVTELPLALDPVGLDAEARERTVVLIDPVTGKLKKAYLHIPCYRNSRDWKRGGELAKAMDMIERGKLLPSWPPFENRIHWYHLGPAAKRWIPVKGELVPDPIHGFSRFFERRKLPYKVVRTFPLLNLEYIDVGSTDVMVGYLREGGFVLLKGGQYSHLQQELERRVGTRVEMVSVELGHPLFHSFFDITEYRDPSSVCPGVAPLAGLRLDGRLIAISGTPKFVSDAPCYSNQLYVNALAYALIQPSKMGGRYKARK